MSRPVIPLESILRGLGDVLILLEHNHAQAIQNVLETKYERFRAYDFFSLFMKAEPKSLPSGY